MPLFHIQDPEAWRRPGRHHEHEHERDVSEQPESIAFRQQNDDVGEIRNLPDDAFKESGTGVRTVMVRLEKLGE